MTRRLFLSAFLSLLPTVSFAQQGSASPIDGVWRIAEAVITGNNPSTITNPQPSMLIFARGHYSWINVNGTTARIASPPATPGKLTDAEKIARYEEWSPFAANAGTFEIKGSTLTRRPLVAKNVNVMAPTATPIVHEFKLEGDTLILVNALAQGQPGEQRLKLTRIR